VVEYITPEKFDELKEIALAKGFKHVASGPLVRSSYHAADFRPELDVLDDIEADLRGTTELEVKPSDLGIPAAKPDVFQATLNQENAE